MEGDYCKNLITKANSSIQTIYESLSTLSGRNFEIQEKMKVKEEYLLDSNILEATTLIGKGAAGEVYIGKRSDTGDLVAIKNIKIQNENEAIYILSNEIAFMTHYQHKNLVKCCGYCIKNGEIKIVMELCQGGNVMKAYEKGNLNPKQKIKILLDTAKGLQFLHSQDPPLLHRDIKPLNILLDKPIESNSLDFTAKIADYGISRVFPSKEGVKTITCTGTPIYQAPEILVKAKSGIRVDIYSFGIMIHELFSEKIPYKDFARNANQFTMFVSSRKLRPTMKFLKSDTPPVIIDLMSRCWAHDQDDRPFIDEIVIILDSIYESL